MREGASEFDGVVVWCNHNEGYGDSRTSNVPGHRAAGREAMQTAVGKYDDWSNVRVNLQVDDIDECVQLAVNFAIDVWDSVGVPTMIIVDECHHLFRKDGSDAGTWILKEGRDRGIKGVFATQNPKAIPEKANDALMNCRYYVWVGEYSAQNKGWLQYYEYPLDELPGERFKYMVFNRSMETLYSAETQEKYGG